MRKRAAKYRRISEDREGRELGVERQDQDLDALVARLGLKVVADYVDNDIGASTRSKKPRPGYRQMLDDARAGRFDVILAYTSGRLTRRPREHEDLIDLAVDCGVRFEYVRSPSFDLNTAQGRRIARTLAAQDAGESEEIGERVSRAARQRAENGHHHGGRRAFGYTVDGRALVESEAAELRRAYHAVLDRVPLGVIARDLRERGVPSVTGAPWAPGTVRDMLLRASNYGASVHQGRVVAVGKRPAVVDEDVWHAVRVLLTDPARKTATSTHVEYLLSGLARCGVCGRPVTSGGKKTGGGIYRLYRCRNGSHVGRRADWIDRYVAQVVVERLSQPDAAELFADRDRPDAAELRVQAHALRVRIEEVRKAFEDLDVPVADSRATLARLTARLAEVEVAWAQASRAPALAELVAGRGDVQRLWDELSLPRQRAVVEALMTVTLLPGGGGRRVFEIDPTTGEPRYVKITWKAS